MADREYPAGKTTAIAELADEFSNATATVLTEYRGLSVAELRELRRSLGEGTQYRVAKNTLAKRAANQVGVTGLDELFVGPTAITFIEGDPVEAAKSLRNFAKTHEALVIKGGYMEGKALSVEEITKLVNDKVKADSYDLVFDKSGMSLNGVSVVMFAKDAYDFTDTIITTLNKNKGKEEPAAAAPAGAAPAAATPKADPKKKGN